MFKITRTKILVSITGLALLLALGSTIVMLGYDPGMNQGGEPSLKQHPNSKVDADFNPKYTMLLHLEVDANLIVKAIRLQFPASDPNGKNDWESNQRIIENWIHQINIGNISERNHPTGMIVKEGLTGFVFNQPHHFVIYIKNKNVKFDPIYPVWFGSRLIGNVESSNDKKSDKNRSFFAASVLPTRYLVNPTNPSDPYEYATSVLYMKNFYQVRSWTGSYSTIDKQKEVYSLNINTLVSATKLDGTGAIDLPLIIDPDTGNMGGGDPAFIR